MPIEANVSSERRGFRELDDAVVRADGDDAVAVRLVGVDTAHGHREISAACSWACSIGW